MAPRLRVLAGTSPETMQPITSLVNTGKPYTISSPLFEGKIAAYIKGMTDEKGRVRDSEYFNREDKAGVTWSIQVQGALHLNFVRFHEAYAVYWKLLTPLQVDSWYPSRWMTFSLEIHSIAH